MPVNVPMYQAEIAGRGLQPRPKLKYLAICFKVFAYCEPRMNADGGLISVHPCSSAVCESCFPGENPGKLLARYLCCRGLTKHCGRGCNPLSYLLYKRGTNL